MPSKAETLLPSYQTTPRTQRALPIRPAPPLPLTARLPCAQAVARWLLVDAQAARPRDTFNLREAGAQAVGRGGGRDGRVFNGVQGLLAAPLCACRC